MGLGAPKRRNKLSNDPNNTQWSKSTNTYGHKILSAQGWKPGEYLGAENAGHADHYTGANASHIRVLLREDNLGLGAQLGKVNTDTFGLSLFSGVLGRLNGKSDVEVQKHQNALRDAELRAYQAQKYGSMNFVSGGFLVGDRIQESKGGDISLQQRDRFAASRANATSQESKNRVPRAKETGAARKKRNVEAEEQTTNASSDNARETSYDDKSEASETIKKTETKKTSKFGRREKSDKFGGSPGGEDERALRKQERRARKDERRKRKEQKRQAQLKEDSLPVKSALASRKDGIAEASSVRLIPGMPGSRHAVRHRYIQQKRMASLDPQAMKEVFMLKAIG